MKDRSMEIKISLITIHAVTFLFCAYWILYENPDIGGVEILLSFTGYYMLGYQFRKHKKTKYTFKIWLKILILNREIKRLKKVAESNLKGKGRDKQFCNPVYTAREVLRENELELKELVR